MKIKFEGIYYSLNIFFNIYSLIYFKIFKKINTNIFSAVKKFTVENHFFLKKEDVLVKVLQCGLCGSDTKILTYNYSFLSSAFLLSKTIKANNKKIYMGHEIVGEVIKVGKNIKKFKKGDKVIFDAVIRNEQIEKERKYAGWTNFFITNSKQLVKVNRKLLNDHAVLIEPLACALKAVNKVKIKNNDKILILGSGTIAILTLKLLNFFYKKNKVFLISNDDKNSKYLSNIEFSISNNIIKSSEKLLNIKSLRRFNNNLLISGFDKIFDCSGDTKIINSILKIANYNSQIVLLGMNMHNVKIDPSILWLKDIDIFSSNGYDENFKGRKTLEYLSNLVFRKKIDLSDIKLSKYKLYDWKKFINQRKFSDIKKVLEF